MKKLFYLLFLPLLGMSMVSCSDDDKDPENPDVPGGDDEPVVVLGPTDVYVLTQGNMYSNIEGSLDAISLFDMNIKTGIFKAANNRSLGDTPQCMAVYGSKIYIGTSQSNTIEIIDKATNLSIKQIKLADDPTHGTSPYSMVCYKGGVYMSMYDGYLARLDTLTLAIDKSVKVGPNPDQIALYRGKIYVPESDGMNYPTYGKTASIVNPETMTVEKRFEVGLNPRQFIVCDDCLYLLCSGNYTDVESMLYRVNYDYTVTEICKSHVAGALRDKIAVAYTPYSYTPYAPTYSLVDAKSGEVTTWNFETPEYPHSFWYNQTTNTVMIGSYVMDGDYPSYTLPGYVNLYNGDNFKFQTKFTLGSGGPAYFAEYVK
ncbi:MAG: YncE family protein [Lepagella sp.]